MRERADEPLNSNENLRQDGQSCERCGASIVRIMCLRSNLSMYIRERLVCIFCYLTSARPNNTGLHALAYCMKVSLKMLMEDNSWSQLSTCTIWSHYGFFEIQNAE